MATDESREEVHPWRIYGKEYEVPASKMGKGSVATDWEKERTITEKAAGDEEKSMEKSLERLDEMAKSVAPAPGDEATDLLKACKACMDKAATEKKAYLGEAVIPEKKGEKARFTGEGAMPAGAPVGGGGVPKPGTEKIVEQQTKQGKPPGGIEASMGKGGELSKRPPEPMGMSVSKAKCPKCDCEPCKCKGAGKCPKCGGEGKECKCPVEKALTSRAFPRIPPGMRQEMIRRNAQSVMTRGNSRFAKDIHTGPLTGEVVEEVEGDAMRRTTQEVYKSCNMCGRRFMEKSFPEGCPTCSVNKSNHCGTCGKQLVKSHGGSVHCPLCG